MKRHTLFNFVILVPIFLVFSLFLSRWFDGHKMDFSQYWQAGRMVLAGQDVYDTGQWLAASAQQGTAQYSEPAFLYPLPLAILFTLPSLLPLQVAYAIWLFVGQVLILTSIVILLGFYPERSGYFELLAITGIFFFRPMFSIFNSGQIVPLLVLCVSLSIKLFHEERWFAGGVLLSILSLKPSVGFTILVLSGLWLLFGKRWSAIGGMLTGGLLLMSIGSMVNFRWVLDYISTGGGPFSKFFGMHPTLWGAVNKVVGKNTFGLAVTIFCVLLVVAVEAYLFWKYKKDIGPLAAFATILPVALLVAPYSWNYDQVLLIIPIVFLLICTAKRFGFTSAMLFMLGTVALSMVLVGVAYFVHHDVWSVVTTLSVWLFSLYFVSPKRAELADAVPNNSAA